ncbi:hypothetical protein Ancab_021220 [Ancistrocladus abbreviatus]
MAMLLKLKYYGGSQRTALCSSLPSKSTITCSCKTHHSWISINIPVKLRCLINNNPTEGSSIHCRARRRVRYEEEEDSHDEEEEYGYNAEIAMLEFYSQSAKEEVLVVKAMLDDREEEILIFKGFSSCLSHRTVSDPSKSVLPARAVIKSIDRIKGPFNPSDIEYIEKGLTWEAFKSRLQSN